MSLRKSAQAVDRPRTGPRGLRERQRQARDEAILEAAFRLIAENGYDALTMDGLADRVGISRQTLYHHFSCKEDIALRAILTLMQRGIQSIEDLDPALPPSERLQRVVRWMMEQRFSPDLAAFVRARPALMPIKQRPEYQEAFERRAAALAGIVEAAQAAGEVRTDMPSRLIVQMLLGLVAEARYEDVIASGAVSPAQVADMVTEVFFRGTRA